MEIELKYLIKDENAIKRILEDSYLVEIKDQQSEEEKEMHAIYFDTEDKSLYQRSIAFRIRRENSKLIATLKWNGYSEDGMHKREEINVPVDNETKLTNPDITIFDQSEMYSILEEATGEKPLLPVMDILFHRHQMRLDTGKSICELSVDKGLISANGKTAPILELEIELYSGDEADMRSLGERIANKYNLTPENSSKFKRGIELMKC